MIGCHDQLSFGNVKIEICKCDVIITVLSEIELDNLFFFLLKNNQQVFLESDSFRLVCFLNCFCLISPTHTHDLNFVSARSACAKLVMLSNTL